MSIKGDMTRTWSSPMIVRLITRIPLALPVALLITWFLVGCASEPERMPYTPDTGERTTFVRHEDPNQALASALGMNRLPEDLGFAEKRFDPCTFGVSTDAGCGLQYLSVVHFQLLCRDTEGTQSRVPDALAPIVADSMTWI